MRNVTLSLGLLFLLALAACTGPPKRRYELTNVSPRSAQQVKTMSLGLLTPELEKEFKQLAYDRCPELVNSGGRTLGSAILISADGLALTTCAITGDVSYRVRLSDGSEVDAEIIGTATPNNIALIRLAAGREYACFELMEKQELIFDDLVVAVSASHENGILSAGYVSGIDVSKWSRDGQFLYRCILHTAPTFSGDEGGPLLDRRGRLVGMQIESDRIISASISTDGIREMLELLKQGGEIQAFVPPTPQDEAKLAVKGLLAFAVHDGHNGSTASKQRTVDRLMENLDEYEDLYAFLRSHDGQPTDRFVSMVKNDIARLPAE